MKHFAALLLVFALAACGFHVRGAQSLPFDSIYLGLGYYDEMGADLRRQIAANGSTRIVDDLKDAQVQMQVVANTREKIILSLNTDGKVREYQLRQRFVFKVVDTKGREVIPANEINVRRDMTFDDAQVLAKQQEEVLLYRDMQNDVVQQLLRRLASAHWPLPEEPVPAQSAAAKG
ncbi:LPS assembly lipoprotein LptE [Niveibacterium sp. SC-1]|uniref:LPS-assembly lipoprotein LptE n=1 Tax=Niveibacterium sp. SC-1 TaxID=3135646 RepID=UPI00312031F5